MLTTPIRIGVVSDTHLVRPTRRLPAKVLAHLQECDVIFHAGDVCSEWVIETLSEIAPVHAVYGNNDSWELQERLPRERFYTAGAHRLALIHGHAIEGDKPMTARNVALDRMRGLVDCVIYGHSHRPEIDTREGLLMINPGSPTQPRWAPSATFAVVHIGESIEAQLIDV